jgi:hypothetical protein
MVTEINNPEKIGESIQYNEHKIEEAKAECIYAGNFLKDAADLTLPEKKERFDEQIAHNPWAKVNALHVSINFSPDDVLDRDKLIAITQDYLEGIEFKDQPYLIYQHFDAAHPHLHLVTTNIRDNGDPINLHFFRRKKSEPARKATEKKFDLVRAKGRKQQQQDPARVLPPEVLQYGKRPTLEAVTDVLNYVLHHYQYRNMEELNAILRLYNLRADQGKPGGRMHANGGLLYKMLNAEGKYVGVPIKSSAIYFKPGLKWLEQKFQANQQIDPAMTGRMRSVIAAAVTQHPANWKNFTEFLRRKQVAAVPHLDKQGQLLDLSFVDLEAKDVSKATPDQIEMLGILFRQEGLDQSLPDELTQKANRRQKRGRSHS